MLRGSFVFALFTAMAATASAIPVASVDAQWSDPVPTSVAISGPGADGSTTATWGTAAGSRPSSYVFTPTATPFDAPADGSLFGLGTFVHNNFPITGSSLGSIVLNLDTNIGRVDYAFSFDFSHEETANSPPCAYPGSPNCSDRVSVSSVSSPNQFEFEGQTYLLSIVGFQVDGTPASAFITTENASNAARLLATITPVATQVPEPFTLALLGAGLIGVAAAGRTRRAD